MAKIGFTGTHKHLTEDQQSILTTYLRLLSYSGPHEFHHGDCIGADAFAHHAAKELGFRIVIHPPENPYRRAWMIGDEIREEKGFIARNHDIVDECDSLLACPDSRHEKLRSGTWATIRYAQSIDRLKHRISIFFPDGGLR